MNNRDTYQCDAWGMIHTPRHSERDILHPWDSDIA